MRVRPAAGILAGMLAVTLSMTARGAGNELGVRVYLDPDRSQDADIGCIGRYGRRVSPDLCLGVYGLGQTTDRRLPSRMRQIWGMGVFAECGPDLRDFPLFPYAGLSIGLLDPSDVDTSTLLHLIGSVGLQFPVGRYLSFSAGASVQWVNDDFFDQRLVAGGGFERDQVDFTGDLGMSVAF